MDKKLKQVAHETIKGLHDIGLVDKFTMKHFDTLCLPSLKTLTPQQIKKLRLREKVSQPVLAQILNVSSSTVKHWEIGDKHPSGAALKLLNLISERGLVAVI